MKLLGDMVFNPSLDRGICGNITHFDPRMLPCIQSGRKIDHQVSSSTEEIHFFLTIADPGQTQFLIKAKACHEKNQIAYNRRKNMMVRNEDNSTKHGILKSWTLLSPWSNNIKSADQLSLDMQMTEIPSYDYFQA